MQEIPPAIRQLDYSVPASQPKYRLWPTLAILLAAIVIGGAIIEIVRPKFSGPVPIAEFARSDISDISTALAAFRVDNGRLPTSSEGLLALQTASLSFPHWKGPYLHRASWNTDPWGNPFVYVCPGIYNPKSFDLFSMGPDGKIGGGDDIDN